MVPNPGPRRDLWCRSHTAATRYGHSGQADHARVAMAEWVRGETNRHDPTGVRRPPDRAGRISPSPDPLRVRRILYWRADPSRSKPGCPSPSGCSVHRRYRIKPRSRRPPSPILLNLVFGTHRVLPVIDLVLDRVEQLGQQIIHRTRRRRDIEYGSKQNRKRYGKCQCRKGADNGPFDFQEPQGKRKDARR